MKMVFFNTHDMSNSKLSAFHKTQLKYVDEGNYVGVLYMDGERIKGKEELKIGNKYYIDGTPYTLIEINDIDDIYTFSNKDKKLKLYYDNLGRYFFKDLKKDKDKVTFGRVKFSEYKYDYIEDTYILTKKGEIRLSDSGLIEFTKT